MRVGAAAAPKVSRLLPWPRIGSGPVAGFAVTLAIGIVTSMFTAIMGSRAAINLIYGGRTVTKLHI